MPGSAACHVLRPYLRHLFAIVFDSHFPLMRPLVGPLSPSTPTPGVTSACARTTSVLSPLLSSPLSSSTSDLNTVNDCLDSNYDSNTRTSCATAIAVPGLLSVSWSVVFGLTPTFGAALRYHELPPSSSSIALLVIISRPCALFCHSVGIRFFEIPTRNSSFRPFSRPYRDSSFFWCLGSLPDTRFYCSVVFK